VQGTYGIPDLPDAFLIGWVAVIGAFIGSFLNVVIYRVPMRRSIVAPGSRCGFCESPVRWYDNVPVLSWIVLGGRCRWCGVGISPRYALVELLTSLLFVAVLHRFGAEWHTPVYALFCAALVAVTFIDIDHRIIPDSISKSGVVIGVAVAAILPSTPEALLPVTLTLSLAGAVLGYFSLLAVSLVGKALFRRESMGLGDVKLLAMIGAFLGPLSLPFIFVVAPLAGSTYGITAALLRGRRIRGATMPFGPFLSAAAIAYLLGGSEYVLAWLRASGGGP
jgi:leader peptidase (prepilin peptidase) / N-methyltransferase